MHTLGIHHVSINVSDLPAAERFYCDVLGLEKLPRPDLGFAGAWLQTGEQQVHLLGKSSGDPLPEQHYAFLIEDADALLARLSAYNIEPRNVREIPGICRQVFVHDPSGNLVEFNQPISTNET
jgi:catechol 2,3-dioxygenase-like lactoylglutathione lyase family enzyme